MMIEATTTMFLPFLFYCEFFTTIEEVSGVLQ
jgi:hypothetical protein